jgi:hypothetical protein
MARFQQEAMKKGAEFLGQKVAELEHCIKTEAVNKDECKRRDRIPLGFLLLSRPTSAAR